MPACKHAFDVAIEDRKTIAPGLRKDRAGSAAADAGQGDQRVEVAWQVAVMQLDAALRRGVQVAGAGVVAQARP